MTIEEIKSLMKSGDVAGAAEAAEELLKGDSDNVQALMLYGTCRQLQGDEATFRDTYRAVKEHLDAMPGALDAETKAAWGRFSELCAKLDQPELRRRGSAPLKSTMLDCAILAAGIVAALVIGIWYFGGTIMSQFEAVVRPDALVRPDVDKACCAADYSNEHLHDIKYFHDDTKQEFVADKS